MCGFWRVVFFLTFSLFIDCFISFKFWVHWGGSDWRVSFCMWNRSCVSMAQLKAVAEEIIWVEDVSVGMTDIALGVGSTLCVLYGTHLSRDWCSIWSISVIEDLLVSLLTFTSIFVQIIFGRWSLELVHLHTLLSNYFSSVSLFNVYIFFWWDDKSYELIPVTSTRTFSALNMPNSIDSTTTHIHQHGDSSSAAGRTLGYMKTAWAAHCCALFCDSKKKLSAHCLFWIFLVRKDFKKLSKLDPSPFGSVLTFRLLQSLLLPPS